MSDTQATPEFKVGDVVQLNAGSPLLTITNIPTTVEDGDEEHVDLICWDRAWKKPTLLLNIAAECLVKVVS